MDIAFLTAPEGTEQIELTEPWRAVAATGDRPSLLSTRAGTVQAFRHLDRGDLFPVDGTVAEADPGEYGAQGASDGSPWKKERRSVRALGVPRGSLRSGATGAFARCGESACRASRRHGDPSEAPWLPGGVANPDALRLDADAVAFTRSFFEAGKPVAAICHAPWLLVEAGVLDGRVLTSWPSLRTDIRNAGGTWVDVPVQVCDHGPNLLITSRRPDDLPEFTHAFTEAFATV